ncbi:RepB [Lactococcus cremoris subsp. tructae]|uniref:RepB n=1 Tax=Lactococcus cremoris subsp. tructae TaxID=542833 RepID=A0A2A5SN08_LACLC|nr:RepB [Lactococcus cremoris subsp. tructae]
MTYLNELDKKKVVEHNDLITSVAKMDKVPLKIFELAVSCIDTENPPKDNIIYLSKKELFAFFDVSDNGKHTRFKQAVEKMQKQAYFEVKEKKDKGFKFRSIVPIPTVTWNDYSDEVEIFFNPYIMPYLIELKQNFTQYALSDVMELNSKYSIILYKWLCMYYNQYDHYNAKGGRRNDQLEFYRNPSIYMQELRSLTDTVDEYKKFANFETRVLKQPIEEINAHTHFNVTYEKIKKGRTIDSIQFHIEKKKIARNENYKEEQQDEDYLKGKQQKEEQQQKLFAQAMANPYTRMLNETMLLFPQDLMNIETMANLQRFVYPLYDELKEKQGIEGVKTHMSYVSAKQELYSKSKQNISFYLKKSVTSYLESIKIKENLRSSNN